MNVFESIKIRLCTPEMIEKVRQKNAINVNIFVRKLADELKLDKVIQFVMF